MLSLPESEVYMSQKIIMNSLYSIKKQDSPIISAAIHDGHDLFPDFIPWMRLQEHERFREEDPYTSYIAKLPTSRIIVHTSRFQVDLNRPPEQAIYKTPQDAWGLEVWNKINKKAEAFIMKYYHKFYRDIRSLLEDTIHRFGRFIVLDIHSYNHRHDAPHHAADVKGHPTINLGTYYNKKTWSPLFEDFRDYLILSEQIREPVDVRENILFKGGAFAQWIIRHYGKKGCVISIEYKKTFMDEWTGRADIGRLKQIRKTLKGALPILYKGLLAH